MALTLNRILKSEQLPSMPGIGLKVIQLAGSPEADTREIIHLIKSDPALTAKLLRTVNSSAFGLRHEVNTIEQAVPLLGTTSLINLMLTFSLLPGSQQQGPLVQQLEAFWRNSLTQAVTAENLARRAGGGSPAEYFVAGLLQDVGILALLRAAPEEYLKVLEEFDRSERPLVEIEQEQLDLTHVEISVQLCTQWGLTPMMQDVIAGHHASPEELDKVAGTELGPLQTAMVTATAVAEYFGRRQKSVASELVEELTRRYYFLGGDALDAFLEKVSTRVREMAESFSLEVGQCPSYEDILTAAQVERDAMSKKSLCDPLTGLRKRNDLENQLYEQWRRASETRQSLGVILLDLDYFKQLNDTYGTPAGDTALKWVARELESWAGELTIVVARYGGDEFAVLVAGPTQVELQDMAEGLRHKIACSTIPSGSGNVEITVSVGVALCAPHGCQEGSRELLRAAENALRQSKGGGGNQVQLASDASGALVS